LPKRWPFLWRFFIDPQGLAIFFWTLSRLPYLLWKRFDVVIPLNGGWQPALVRLVAWIYGGRMVISGQSGRGWDDRNNLWSFPDLFITPTSFAATWAKKVNSFVKVKYIPNGVDLDRFKPSGEKISVGLKTPVVLCVAALVPQKRIDLVIKAVAHTNASLVIAGDGYLKEELQNLGNELLSEDRFKIIKVDQNDMQKVYRSADLFCFVPEPIEAFGIVYVEAMASGLGVVTINDDVRHEIVGDAGLFVKDPTDSGELAKLIDEGLKKKWGGIPRKQAEKFSWGEVAKQYEESICSNS
jgi:glycosyltransferase involved in cell wall biosynthesis